MCEVCRYIGKDTINPNEGKGSVGENERLGSEKRERAL